MKKRLCSWLLVLVMVLGMFPASAMATGTDPTVVYTTANGPWGGMVYINKATISGVTVTGYEWDGNTCNVALAEGTAATASVTFSFEKAISGGQPQMLGAMVISLNGTASGTGKTSGSIQLNGTERTEVVVSISGPGVSGTTQKTFVFTIPAPNHVPTLIDPAKTGESDIVTVDTAYAVALGSMFADEDGDAISYRMSVNGGAAVAAETVGGVYTYNCPEAGDFELRFTAVDSKGDASLDAYTVTLKVTPKNTSENNYTASFTLPEGVAVWFYTLGGVEGAPAPGTALNAVQTEQIWAVEVPEGSDTLYIRFADRYLVTKVAVDDSFTLRETAVFAKDLFGTEVAGTITVADADGCTASAAAGKYYLAEGKIYTVSFAPADAGAHRAASADCTVSAETEEITVDVAYNKQKIIVTPKGATAQVFVPNNYYSYKSYPCRGGEENPDGTVSHYFAGVTLPAGGGNSIYRVTYGDYIVKAGWSDASSTVTVTYSADDLKDTARVNYAASTEDSAQFRDDSVLLNINGRNHLSMAAGSTKTLKAYRAWEIIPVSYNNWIIEPDFHFNVVWESEEGVVTLTEANSPMTGGESWMNLTANKSGTAIVEVTYDAVNVRGGAHYSGTYGASDPARTGLAVITVGGSDAGVEFGVDCFASIGIQGPKNTTYNPNNKKAWDAEFDTLYFFGESGSLTFAPTASSAITEVAVSNDKGASWQALTAEDGVYTAAIVPGNNILRVTTEAGTAYQVVRGDRVTYTVAEVAGEGKSNGNGIVDAGETIRITLEGLHIPVPKVAGNYNPGYGGNTDGYSGIHINYTMGETAVYGPGSQYNFPSATNYLDITVPAEEESVSLTNGYIGMGVIGLQSFVSGGDSHRNIPDVGCITRDNKSTWHTRSILPEIALTVGQETTDNQAPVVRADAPTTATLQLSDTLYTYAINLATAVFSDPDSGDTLTYTVQVNGGEAAAVADGYYQLERPAAGTYELLFAASDGKATAQHTVTLTVTAAEPPASGGDSGGKGDEDPVEGYVYVSFEDYGVRVPDESGVDCPRQLGMIVSKTRVPFYKGDTIADVTLRLLDTKGISYDHSGTTKNDFYLAALCDFTLGGVHYDVFGQFDAGAGSGWMITWDGEFINKGASAFTVKNGDVIRWQYTCQYGKDIGDPFWGGSDSSSGSSVNDLSTDISAAHEVKNLISAIGTVTKDSGDAIKAARAAYDALTDTQKDLVPNYDDLVTAEKKYAELTKDEQVFADVSEDAYYYEAVKWAVEKGITSGTSETTFSPNASCTRAQMVTFLWRAAGSPKASATTCNFTDIAKDAYYYEALLWAVENGITSGTSATTFSPDVACSRGQMAMFLYRSAKTPSISGDNSFRDVSGTAYYKDAIIWAKAEGITAGTSATTFSPDDACTRSQMVTFLYRYLAE